MSNNSDDSDHYGINGDSQLRGPGGEGGGPGFSCPLGGKCEVLSGAEAGAPTWPWADAQPLGSQGAPEVDSER